VDQHNGSSLCKDPELQVVVVIRIVPWYNSFMLLNVPHLHLNPR
jgi:hypothetical protein